jgi:hypothetical protein
MAGRPKKFIDIDEFKAQIDNYFLICDEQGKPYTISGLAYALNTSRDVLMDYQDKYSGEFPTP